MWICPKCSRENGNSFSSCKGCGYVISEKEKSYAIENTKQKIENYNSRHSLSGTTPGHTAYNGPKISYDNDDEYLENYYTDDMFDDDDYEKSYNDTYEERYKGDSEYDLGPDWDYDEYPPENL